MLSLQIKCLFLGFVKALVTELWGVLECGRDDVRVTHPRSTPVDPIDRSCQKVTYFVQLLCSILMHALPHFHILRSSQGGSEKLSKDFFLQRDCTVK